MEVTFFGIVMFFILVLFCGGVGSKVHAHRRDLQERDTPDNNNKAVN